MSWFYSRPECDLIAHLKGYNMRSSILIFALSGLSILSGAANAGEETLPFKLVVRDLAELTHSEPATEGVGMAAYQSIGVAVFDNGRLAYKEFVNVAMNVNPPVKSPGFSNYVFANGDSLQVSFLAGPGDGGFFVDYTILSGTGAYAGATGDGRLQAMDASWADATLFEGAFRVVTP